MSVSRLVQSIGRASRSVFYRTMATPATPPPATTPSAPKAPSTKPLVTLVDPVTPEEEQKAFESEIGDNRMTRKDFNLLMETIDPIGAAKRLKEQGKNPFFNDLHYHDKPTFEEEIPDTLYGQFGTIKNPVVVKSAFHSRLVGCHGTSEEDSHILLWHNVTDKKPCVCVECGQTFVLKHIKQIGGHH